MTLSADDLPICSAWNKALQFYLPCFEPLLRDTENKVSSSTFTKENFYFNCAINQYLDSSFINIWHLNFYYFLAWTWGSI